MRLDWDAPCPELGNVSPSQWLTLRYPDAVDNHELAGELAGLLGVEENLYERVRIKAGGLELRKTVDARRALSQRRAERDRALDRPAVHIFQDWEVSQWDTAIVTSDWHIPFWNPGMARRMMLVAQNWKPDPITNLNIGGDFLDFGQVGVFLAEEEEIPRKVGDDLEHTEEVLDWLLDWFEDVVILKANHEARLAKVLQKQVNMQRLQRLVSKLEHFTWSNWSWCIIEDSLGNRWRVTHPGRRWKNLNRLAQELANCYQMNVILAHSHVMSLGYNISGDYITIDSGGMLDPQAMGYYIKTDAPYWKWCPGFLVLDKGKVHAFNDIWTDWEFYSRALDVDLVEGGGD